MSRRRIFGDRHLWYLRGRMRGHRPIGTACTEYGDKTLWLRLPGGALVWAYRRLTYEEVVADIGPEDAPHVWNEFAQARREDGLGALSADPWCDVCRASLVWIDGFGWSHVTPGYPRGLPRHLETHEPVAREWGRS